MAATQGCMTGGSAPDSKVTNCRPSFCRLTREAGEEAVRIPDTSDSAVQVKFQLPERGFGMSSGVGTTAEVPVRGPARCCRLAQCAIGPLAELANLLQALPLAAIA